MEHPRTVKARRHHGANSLDLTLPVDVCKTLGIRAGDVFSVEALTEGGRVVVTYRKVHPK